MAHPKIYCITNIQSEKLEKLSVNLVGVGKNSFNSNYIKCEGGENINFKERWPTIFPTSTISIRRDSFSNFINETSSLNSEEQKNLFPS